MGHSLIRQKLSQSNVNQTYNYQSNAYFPPYSFEDSRFKSDMAFNIQTEGLNSIFLGLINDIAWKFGTFGTSLQNNLFKTTDSTGNTYAIDLQAMNINRGRDHGLQPYNNYAKECFNVTINKFSDLSPRFMNPTSQILLQSLYEYEAFYQKFNIQIQSLIIFFKRNVNDTDLYVGGLSEIIVNNFTVRPTFACIIMNQFDNLKRGDIFYYENRPSSSTTSFSLDQLTQIKNVTIAGLICKNIQLIEVNVHPI